MVQSGELGHIKRITWIATQWYRPQAYHDSAGWRSTWATEGGGTMTGMMHQSGVPLRYSVMASLSPSMEGC